MIHQILWAWPAHAPESMLLPKSSYSKSRTSGQSPSQLPSGPQHWVQLECGNSPPSLSLKCSFCSQVVPGVLSCSSRQSLFYSDTTHAGKIPWDYYPNFVSPLLVHLSQSLRFNAYSWFIHLFHLKRTLILKYTFVSTIHWFSTIKMSTTQRNLMWLNYKILQNSILKKIIWSQ